MIQKTLGLTFDAARAVVGIRNMASVIDPSDQLRFAKRRIEELDLEPGDRNWLLAWAEKTYSRTSK